MKRMGVTGGLVVAMILVCGSATRAGAQGDSGAEVSKAQYDTWMTELSNWGRWGPDDELGALNLITAKKRRASAALVVDGVTGKGRHGVAVQPNRHVLRASNAVSFHAVEPDQRASADSVEPDQRAQEP